jgi:hypothetical protein
MSRRSLSFVLVCFSISVATLSYSGALASDFARLTSAHQSLADVIPTVQQYLPDLATRLTVCPQDAVQKNRARPNEPRLPDEVCAALRTIEQPIAALEMGPTGAYLVSVDMLGAIRVLRTGGKRRQLETVREGMSADEYRVNEAKTNHGSDFVRRGWDPPATKHEAMFRGLDTFDGGRTIEIPPPMRWEITRGTVAQKTETDCVLIVYRKNFSDDKTFIPGTEVVSLCPGPKGFLTAMIVSGWVAGIEPSPDSRWVARMTPEGLVVSDFTGKTLYGPVGEQSLGELRWLNASVVLTYQRSAPAYVHDVARRKSAALALRMRDGRSIPRLRIETVTDDPVTGSLVLQAADTAEYSWNASEYDVARPVQGH